MKFPGWVIFTGLLALGIPRMAGQNTKCVPEGAVQPNDRDCFAYEYCMNGIWKDEKCLKGYYFDKNKLACRLNEGQCAPPPPPPIISPCKTYGPEHYPIDNDCTRFTKCTDGRPVTFICAPGRFYSAINGTCVNAATCPQVTTPTTTTTTTTPRPPVIISPCKTYGREHYPIDSYCTRYTECNNGRPVTVVCASGRFYSAINGTCVTAATCPQDTTTTTTTTTTTPRPPVIVPPCTSLTRQAFEIANDCTKFLYCLNGSPFVVQCNTGEFFNIKTGTCVKATQCPQGKVKTLAPITVPTTTTTTTYPGDPSQYYYCYNGTALVVKCPSNMIYNAALSGCGPK